MEVRKKKRAITLAGGGPAAGLHIGALQALQDGHIDFQVWALSCIGAWVGILYNQWTDDKGNWAEEKNSWTDEDSRWMDVHGKWTKVDGGQDKAQRTLNFFRKNVFREDTSYSRFPLNSVFAPDLAANAKALFKFLTDRNTATNLWLPHKAMEAFENSVRFWSNIDNWLDLKQGSSRPIKEGNINYWALNEVLAVHPLSRFLTSLVYLAPVTGLSRIYYEDSSFLNAISIENLRRKKTDKDLFIYHNAWDMDNKRIQLFSNIEKDGYKDISRESLCACSALPYIEESVTIKDKDAPKGEIVYCEGALVDTVNFRNLIEDHNDLDEVWVSRIVDPSQARAPLNIKDAIGNLSMLFAGALGDDDVKLFKYHAREEGWRGTIYELNYFYPRQDDGAKNGDDQVGFDWNWYNFDNGLRRGYRAATELLNLYYCFEAYLYVDLDAAYKHASKLTSEGPLAQVARAITFPHHGRRNEAGEAIKRLKGSDRAWQAHPERELRKTFFADDKFEKIMTGLRDAGLR